MKNIEMKQEGNKLIIIIDTAAPGSPSKSGKSIIIATTAGNQEVTTTSGRKCYLGINFYTN
jgi:hypothetical protein